MVQAATAKSAPQSAPHWGTGPEGTRRADLGNGWYRNPIMPGDYADPSVLKDGDDYYMTHSSFDAAPGLIIWHSRDLVNWQPIGPALPKPLGTVFAVDIAKHDGRYYIYPFHEGAVVAGAGQLRQHLCHPRRQHGRPVERAHRHEDRRLIDPGHVVGEDGHRYLFLSGINRVRLSADGLSTEGPVEKAYDGWHYPDDWVTEGYSLEGPKLFRRGAWFYLVSAVGGTSGPATSHMVIVARSRSVLGPWENCPHNPIVRTRSDKEAWWSRGHATMVEGRAANGRWSITAMRTAIARWAARPCWSRWHGERMAGRAPWAAICRWLCRCRRARQRAAWLPALG
jgi:xylan 1,4-beta-xylosidase